MRMPFFNLNRNLIQDTGSRLFLRPHLALRPYISHYTVSFYAAPEEAGRLVLIPDASGCFVFTCYENQINDHVYGATTRTVIVRNDDEDVLMCLFIEFSPGGLFYFTDIPLWELTDRVCSMREWN